MRLATVQRLRTLDQSLVFIGGDLEGRRSFAEERDNGLARVATDDGDLGLGGVLLASELLGEGLSTNHIEGGDTEETSGVEDTGGLEDLGGNGDGGVDRVGDDQYESLGAELGNALDQIADDASVDLEKVITRHTGLAWEESVERASTEWRKTNGECQRG